MIAKSQKIIKFPIAVFRTNGRDIARIIGSFFVTIETFVNFKELLPQFA